MLQKFTAVGSGIVEVDKPMQGVILKNIRLDSTIKIDFISKTTDDVNRLPTMTIEQLAQFYQEVYSRDIILEQADENSYVRVLVPFAVSGCLDLTEDNMYRISLGNLNNRTVEVHEFDSPFNSFSPIQFQRVDIKASLPDDEINVTGASYLYFPNGLPTKMEHRVAGFTNGRDRKVTIQPEQIAYHNKANRIVGEVTSEGAEGTIKTLLIGTELQSYPVQKISVLTVHKNEGEEFIFYKVNL